MIGGVSVPQQRMNPGEPIRVAVVDDQELFRRGLTMLLGVEEDIEVVGEAGDGVAATELAARTGALVAAHPLREQRALPPGSFLAFDPWLAFAAKPAPTLRRTIPARAFRPRQTAPRGAVRQRLSEARSDRNLARTGRHKRHEIDTGLFPGCSGCHKH